MAYIRGHNRALSLQKNLSPLLVPNRPHDPVKLAELIAKRLPHIATTNQTVSLRPVSIRKLGQNLNSFTIKEVK